MVALHAAHTNITNMENSSGAETKALKNTPCLQEQGTALPSAQVAGLDVLLWGMPGS